MKKLTLFFSLALGPLLSFTAQAEDCPDLTGTFLCKENSYRKDTHYSFQQAAHGADWVYTIIAQTPNGQILSKFNLLTDGQTREVRDLVTGQVLNATARCSNQQLLVEGEAKAPNGATISFRELLSITPQGHLSNRSQDINGDLVQETCERL